MQPISYKFCIKLLSIYIIMVALGWILIYCVYSIPDKFIRKNIQLSERQLIKEGNDSSIWGVRFLKKDNFTDGTMYNILSSAGTGNTLEKSLLNPRAYIPESDLLPFEAGYQATLPGNKNIDYWNYGRYWHGYLIPLSISSFVMPITGLRLFNTIALWLLFIVTTVLIFKKCNWIYGLSFIVANIAACLPSVPYSLQFSTCFFLMFLFSIYILLKGKTSLQNSCIIFFIFGGLTSYFDFLTTPVITLGIPLILSLFINRGNSNLKSCLLIILFWGIGYFALWGAKWIIASVVTNENIISDAIDSIKFRASYNTVPQNGIHNRLYVLVFILMAIPVILISLYTIRYFQKGGLCRNLPILISGLLPIFWYICTGNHTLIHFWFTWRAIIVSIFAISILAITLLTHHKVRYDTDLRQS